MATEHMSHIKEGVIGDEAIVIPFRADEAIDMWSPVIPVTKATGYDMPSVEPTDTAGNALVIGVTVGPLVDSTAGSEACASAAGTLVDVCVYGRCKCKVDGNAANIAVGNGLVTHGADGVAQQVDYTGTVNAAKLQYLAGQFAKALEASTVDGDIIPIFVGQQGTGKIA